MYGPGSNTDIAGCLQTRVILLQLKISNARFPNSRPKGRRSPAEGRASAAGLGSVCVLAPQRSDMASRKACCSSRIPRPQHCLTP